MGAADGAVEDPIAVQLASGPPAGIKGQGHLLCRQHGDLRRETCIEPAQDVLLRPLGGGGKRQHLTQGMHAGVGAP